MKDFTCKSFPSSASAKVPEALGYAEEVYEHVLGEEKYTFVEGVRNPHSCTILIKAGSRCPTHAPLLSSCQRGYCRSGCDSGRGTMCCNEVLATWNIKFSCSAYIHLATCCRGSHVGLQRCTHIQQYAICFKMKPASRVVMQELSSDVTLVCVGRRGRQTTRWRR